jgi:hypothetical protein
MAPRRVFHAEPADPHRPKPILIGIMSPSGGGKTFSALRLATGMQRVCGGDIYGLDTENSRMLHYADQFKFKHVPFSPPFGSLDYLEAVRWCSGQGARVIIVDSMSHEHVGEGGYLETAEAVVTRMAGDDYRKREAVKMLGWATAGPLRQKMIEGMKQLPGCFIFCFRAKEKTKPMRRPDGKTDIVEMGWMPIAGEEWLYEMTVNCMLEPRSDGVPTWRSDFVGERLMMKLPQQFKSAFAERAPLSEDIGEKLAHWAAGRLPVSTFTAPETAAVNTQTSPPTPPDRPAGGLAVAHAAPPADIEESDRIDRIDAALGRWAEQGSEVLKRAWSEISAADQKILKAALDRRHKPAAQAVDAARTPAPTGELPL